MRKAILFDLDGTLTDSGEGIMNCAKLALEHYGLPIPSEAEMRTFVGPPLHDSFIRFGVPAEEADNAIKIYRSRYIPIGKFENEPYEGIREVLEKLKALGHTLYVATSKPESMSVEILEHFDLAKYFDIIGGAPLDNSERGRKAAVIEDTLKRAGITDLSRCIMVGDRLHDIHGAHEVGMPVIGVLYGYGDRAEHEGHGADYIAADLAELETLLLGH